MSPANFLARVIEPGLALVPGYMVSDAARVLLMAIAGQESGLSARVQVGGPALGYWQFEKAGVVGVMVPNGSPVLHSVCVTLDIAPDSYRIWGAIQYNDPLACVVARLCLWNDKAPLPALHDADAAWDYYVRNWKPGKPDESRWDAAYGTALMAVLER